MRRAHGRLYQERVGSAAACVYGCHRDVTGVCSLAVSEIIASYGVPGEGGGVPR